MLRLNGSHEFAIVQFLRYDVSKRVSREIKWSMDGIKNLQQSKTMTTHEAAKERNLNETKIRRLCKRLGITITSGNEFAYYPNSDGAVITERKRCGSTVWVFSMLHELGHHHIEGATQKDGRDLHTRTYTDADITDKRRSTRQRAAMYIVNEEHAAWEYGLHLATVHGITIDRTEYERYAASCFAHYLITLAAYV